MARLMDYCVRNEPLVHYPGGDIRVRTIHEIDTDAEFVHEVQSNRLTLDCS